MTVLLTFYLQDWNNFILAWLKKRYGFELKSWIFFRGPCIIIAKNMGNVVFSVKAILKKAATKFTKKIIYLSFIKNELK